MSYGIHLPSDILLGTTKSGRKVFLDPKARRTHMHVMGASGRGKSYFLEHLIRQDIASSRGVCLIDPHGELYGNIVRWCAGKPHVSWDKLILLDPGNPDWTFGFNPLAVTGEISFSVDAMVSAIAQVWGGSDMNETPRLDRCLRLVLHVLAEQRLTLLESLLLTSEKDENRRFQRLLCTRIQDPTIRAAWEEVNAFDARRFQERFESTNNRLSRFFAAPALRAVLGQRERVLDVRRLMDEGYIVLVNLAPQHRLSADNARLLGTLLVNDLFLKAQERPPGSRPFYLYIDECGDYLNAGIRRILDESRKRGLHLILANQHLAQLRAAGDTVYGAIMTDAQTKVVFGGLGDDDASALVRELFLELDLEEPKSVLSRNAIVGQEKIILSSGGTSRSSSRSSSSGTSRSDGQSLPQGALDDGLTDAARVSWGVGSSESTGESESTSEMTGWTEAYRNIWGTSVGGVFSLEEQRYKAAALLRKQPEQLALVRTPEFGVIPIRTESVRPGRATPSAMRAFTLERFKALECISPRESIAKLIEERYRALTVPAAGQAAEQELVPTDFYE